jgi:hypothetical protein
LGLNEQALIKYCRIRDLWGPANLVASTVTKLDDSPPYLMDDRSDSVGGHPRIPVEVSRGRLALEKGGPGLTL